MQAISLLEKEEREGRDLISKPMTVGLVWVGMGLRVMLARWADSWVIV